MSKQAEYEFKVARILILASATSIIALRFAQDHGGWRYYFQAPRLSTMTVPLESVTGPNGPASMRKLPTYERLRKIISAHQEKINLREKVTVNIADEIESAPYIMEPLKTIYYAKVAYITEPLKTTYYERHPVPTEGTRLTAPFGLRLVQ